jgi:hypothetical protein
MYPLITNYSEFPWPAGLVSCSLVFDISNYEIPVKLICLVTSHQNINILTVTCSKTAFPLSHALYFDKLLAHPELCPNYDSELPSLCRCKSKRHNLSDSPSCAKNAVSSHGDTSSHFESQAWPVQIVDFRWQQPQCRLSTAVLHLSQWKEENHPRKNP